MIEFLQEALRETWSVTCEMAPYLIMGFAIAGVLSVIVTPDFVRRHLGGRGLWQLIKAVLVGVPLPLCSCSVLPVSASLRRHGASRGATLAFLASTPQTGIDSIMVTQGLLGPVFVVFRLVVATISGLLSGALADVVGARLERDGPEAVGEEAAEEKACACQKRRSAGARMLRHAFVTLPGDVGRAMLIGIILAGVLTALVPDNYFADKLEPGLGAMLVMLLLGTPMYVCSSGSVPVAHALIRMGISPGAALVFLVAGPATNAAAVATVWKILGRSGVAIYLFSIAACALAAGQIMDLMGGMGAIPVVTLGEHEHITWTDSIWGVALLAILLPPLLRPLFRRSSKSGGRGPCA